MGTKQTEAMKLALEALKQIDEAMPFPVAKLAQAALREALAEQPAQQEPVAVGSLDSLKLSMQHSAWDGVIQLSDALKNIDDFAKEQPSEQGATHEHISRKSQ